MRDVFYFRFSHMMDEHIEDNLVNEGEVGVPLTDVSAQILELVEAGYISIRSD